MGNTWSYFHLYLLCVSFTQALRFHNFTIKSGGTPRTLQVWRLGYGVGQFVMIGLIRYLLRSR
ncbi:hypothetical protein B0T25DRAFT_553534 [Lasiosphaeria hispida]|uniref:Uncharacterized protein n=1 Tax=Lasiosphaeria hispida TaxID=260671 RepID=A0AAJ0MB83_9PEZI|nr:hypothetical protein B0T25DRAFT_553534 [Lasiosphaeria hispida]